MAASVHACLLLALAVAALGALVLLKKRSATPLQLLIACGVAGLGMLTSQLLNVHLCHEGGPVRQWQLLGPGVFLVLAFVASTRWRRGLATVLCVGMLGLSCHFTELAHQRGWTGNPQWDGGGASALNGLRCRVAAVAWDLGSPPEDTPAGWLCESPVLPTLASADPYLQKLHPRPRRVLQPVWHSALTGLYRYTTVPQDFWWPGGRLAKAAAGIELRDRAPPALTSARAPLN